MTNVLDTYTAKEAMRLTGFQSVAMLDYLQRSGTFLPRRQKVKRRGKERKYEFRDLIVLKAIKRLLDSGASVANLRKSLAEFQKIKWSADPVTLENPEGIIKYLIVCGNSVYLRRDAETLVDLSKSGQLTFSFIIDLENLLSELREDLGMPKLQHELQL